MILKMALVILLVSSLAGAAEPLPEITGDVITDFGTWQHRTYNVTPQVPDYIIADDLSNVTGPLHVVPQALHPMLAAQGFAAGANYEALSTFNKFSGVYSYIKQHDIPLFVTTDACLHSFHMLYDNILKVTEGEYFSTTLITLLDALIEDMSAIRDSTDNSSIRIAAERNITYLTVALKLLDNDTVVDPAVADAVSSELELIAKQGQGVSPVMSTATYAYNEDYSQYQPRGHYTRSPLLEQYFKAMMWCGRISFPLEPKYTVSHISQDDLRLYARQALLLAQSIATVETSTGIPASDCWEQIYRPTVFYVGAADDLTWESYLQVAQDIWGNDFTCQPLLILTENSEIDAFIKQSKASLPHPRINPDEGRGLRFMGQRFVPDSYILDQLVDYGYRSMPRGLDVMTVLGSERAYSIIDEVYGDPACVPWYTDRIAALQTEFASEPAAIWAQDLYRGWLYSIRPLLDEKGKGYPLFMQSAAWQDKSLATSLGSWAQLRHDTLLYVKQSITMTGRPPEPAAVHGYVEPEPEVYSRLASLTAYLREGLAQRGILHEAFVGPLSDFEELMDTFARISVDELENRPLSEADYNLIRDFGSSMYRFTQLPRQFSMYENGTDKKIALIADVHTDPNTGSVLEVGIGHPLPIYVIVPGNGTLTVAAGAMFAYHEFTQPIAQGRLTDEAWQELIDTPKAPEPPVWTSSFWNGTSITRNRR